jgi:hypothetical protein
MSILDDIANPRIPNFLEGLQSIENIQTQKANRRLADIQAGKYLQDIAASRQAMENQAMGSQVIQNFLSQPSPNNSINAPVANELNMPKIPAGEPNPQQQAVTQYVAPFKNLRTDQIKNAQNLTDLANTLMALPGNEKRAKQFYDVADQLYKRINDETPEEWKQSTLLMETTGNQFEQISRLEDSGNYAQAKKQFEDTRQMIMNDPRIAQNPQVAQFYQQFNQYQPGLGTYIYSSTMMGKKARDQYLQDRLAYGQDVETISMGLFDKNYKQLTIPERQRVLEYQTQMKKPGVQVNLGQGANEFQKSLGKESAKKFLDDRDSAMSAVQGLRGITEARTLMNSGIITGFGANYVVNFGKALRRVGINVAENDIDNSNAFIAAQAQQVANIIQQFGAGTGLSDADREFATKAAGGDITLTEGSIKKILDINERAYRNVIKDYNGRAEKIPANIIPYDLKIQIPKEYRTTANQQYTQEDLEYTAKKHGITVDEVKKRLGTP